MCYGDSIYKTCPQCSSFDQIFELRDYCSSTLPTKTWWILPCAIVEEVPVRDLCEGCLRCVDWLKELDTADLPYPSTMNSDNIPRTPVDAADNLEFGDEDDASMAKWSTRSEIPYTSSNHLKAICEWYDTIETSLPPLRQTLSRMSARCITTKNGSLIAKLGILEAEVEVTLSSALADLEYVIETNTWIRQVTSDVNELHTVEVEEIRAAMFEMRMSYIGLVDDEEGSAETITKKLWGEACEFCDLLEGVEEEMMIKNEASGRSQVLEDAGESNLISRVKSLIWC